MPTENYSKKFYPQSLYRKPLNESKTYKELKFLESKLPNFSTLSIEHKKILINESSQLVDDITTILYPNFSNKETFLAKVYKQTGLKENTKKPDTSKSITQCWSIFEKPLLNQLKILLLENFSDQILVQFSKKLTYVVNQYVRYLPRHVANTEKEDLLSIAQIEFLETIKAWTPLKSSDIWPLAYSRINGAMKDYIRYITKSDPARLFDWITDTAIVYKHFNQTSSPTDKIDSGLELSAAMSCLTEREKNIITAHSHEDKTFSTISKELNLSESQVSRIYKKSIEKIKKSLKQ